MPDSFPAASDSGGASFPKGRDPQDAYPTQNGGQMLFRRYRVLRELGRGGMGVVVLAQDTALDIPVAVKLVPDVVVKDTESVTDLRKEVLRGMALMHTGIVRTHNFEKDEGGAGIIMEYVDGDSLAELKMRQPGYCFDPEQTLPWIEQLCSALDYAHREARIVHRDLKPRNLMLSKSGKLKIADFGTAAIITDSLTRHSMEGSISGTLSYMSPQQAEGKRPTILDDIHAVGATIYELLTGKPPFFRGGPMAIHTQVISMVPPSMSERREELEVTGRPPIPAHWEETIAACLAKDPAMRPQSAMEVVARLKVAPRAAPPIPPLPVREATRPHVPEVALPKATPPPLPVATTPMPQWEATRVPVPVHKRGPTPWPIVAILLLSVAGAAIWWFGRDKGSTQDGMDAANSTIIEKSKEENAAPTVSSGTKLAPEIAKPSLTNVAKPTARLGLPAQVIFRRDGGHRFICRGFLDGDGNIDQRPLDPKWKYVTPFYGNLLNVQRDGKWGLIDDSGNVVQVPQWDEEPFLTDPWIFNFSSDFAVIQQSGKGGFIDKTGKVISRPQWENCVGFTEGLAAVQRNGKWGYIDAAGNVVIDLVWSRVGPFSDGLAAVSRDGKWGFIDKSGAVVIPLEWDAVLTFSEQTGTVQRGDKSGYINRNGKVVIPLEPGQGGIFSEGLAAIKRSDKWGYIDKTGANRIKPKFDYADQFIAGLASVQVSGKWGLINSSGDFVLAPRYDSINRQSSGESIISIGKKCGMVDRSGKEILAIDWDSIYVGQIPGGDLPKGYVAAAKRITGTNTSMLLFDQQGRKLWEGNVPTIDENAPHPDGPRIHRVPEKFATIGKAMAQAFPGDTIEVAPGTYNESLTFISGVRLIGAGADKTTIRTEATESVIFVHQCTSGLISDLTLEHIGSNHAETRPPVMSFANSKVEVLRCQIRNSAGHGAGFGGGDRSTMTRCTITGSGWNGASVNGAGNAPIFKQCRFVENAQNGIMFWNGAEGLAEGNNLELNGNSGILASGVNTKPELRSNQCRANLKNGIEFFQGAGGVADTNTCEQNKWCGIVVSGKGTSPALINNHCNDNGNFGIAIEKQCVPTAFSGNTATGNKPKTQIERSATFN